MTTNLISTATLDARIARAERHLTVRQASARAEGICPICWGKGYILFDDENGDTTDCSQCDGTGRWSYFISLFVQH